MHFIGFLASSLNLISPRRIKFLASALKTHRSSFQLSLRRRPCPAGGPDCPSEHQEEEGELGADQTDHEVSQVGAAPLGVGQVEQGEGEEEGRGGGAAGKK